MIVFPTHAQPKSIMKRFDLDLGSVLRKGERGSRAASLTKCVFLCENNNLLHHYRDIINFFCSVKMTDLD